MTTDRIMPRETCTGGVRRTTSTGYLPVHDHKRLPGRFFARLLHSDGRLAA